MDDVLHGVKPAHQAPSQFLNKLPQAVIRNGKVIPIREDVAAMLQPPKSNLEMAMVNTPVDELLNTAQRQHAGPRLPIPAGGATAASSSRSSAQGSNPSSEQITTLQVKREDGGQVY